MSRLPERYLWSRSPEQLVSSFFDGGDGVYGVSRIYEDGENLIAEAPLPGLSPSDIEVRLHHGILWIQGEAKEEEKDKKKKFHRFSQRSYSYSFALPAQIDDKIEPKAEYENGIVKVSLRLAKTSQAKKIRVQGKK